MLNSDELRGSIKVWLESEDYAVSERQEQISDFHLVISNLHGRDTFADIVKLKNKDFVIVGSALQNPADFMNVLSTIPEKDRSDFFTEVQKDLLKFQVDHEFHPNKLLPERMIIRDVVYTEGITRADFMGRLKKVKFASLFLLWSIGYRFSASSGFSSAPHHSSTSNSPQPYG